jgi:hypothetical protein
LNVGITTDSPARRLIPTDGSPARSDAEMDARQMAGKFSVVETPEVDDVGYSTGSSTPTP